MYKIGDRVWLASYERREEKETCPICFGKLAVKLTLGNGDEMILPCEYCGKGYTTPTGQMTTYIRAARVEPLTITGMRIDEDSVEYFSCHRCLDDENTFLTKTEALTRAKVLVAEQHKREETRAEYLKENQQKNYSWNAGYHMRSAKQARKQAEYHERMAILCKAKIRKEAVNAND